MLSYLADHCLGNLARVAIRQIAALVSDPLFASNVDTLRQHVTINGHRGIAFPERHPICQRYPAFPAKREWLNRYCMWPIAFSGQRFNKFQSSHYSPLCYVLSLFALYHMILMENA